MLQAFNTLVKPHVDHLNGLLGVEQTEDWTVIPVKVTFKGGTTQVIEDGIVTECDHTGAYLDETTVPFWNADAHIFEPTGSKTLIVCDKCDAWQDETGEWYE